MRHRIDNKVRIASFITLITASLCGIFACAGDTDGGAAGDQTFDGSSFVGDESSVGGLRLSVNSSDLPVGGTTGFAVEVFDSDGRPVANIEVACDTEDGLALIEPNTGFELTGEFGIMSGVVGCELPGSYQLGCRLPIGVEKRKFETIRCSGAGSAEFPGSGGGTLGSGTGSGRQNPTPTPTPSP